MTYCWESASKGAARAGRGQLQPPAPHRICSARSTASQGLILSDWAITRDCDPSCMTGIPAQTRTDIGMPWGVEKLSKVERYAKAVNAGIDQFGGVTDTDVLVAAVKSGLVSEARLDASVLRVLELKFRLGLFENPFVDPRERGRDGRGAGFPPGGPGCPAALPGVVAESSGSCYRCEGHIAQGLCARHVGGGHLPRME